MKKYIVCCTHIDNRENNTSHEHKNCHDPSLSRKWKNDSVESIETYVPNYLSSHQHWLLLHQSLYIVQHQHLRERHDPHDMLDINNSSSLLTII